MAFGFSTRVRISFAISEAARGLARSARTARSDSLDATRSTRTSTSVWSATRSPNTWTGNTAMLATEHPCHVPVPR